MLGLIGTVGGAVALEIRRIRHKGGPEEAKRKEKELRDLLEVTNNELAKAQRQSVLAESKAQQLEEEKASLAQQAMELNQQKEQLQQNNSQLVLTNIILLNKAKHLEDSSRALVAKQEDLQHQLEQLQRERQAELEASEATLAALKDQVTSVLNRYLSKDIELQAALQEMQALGIELIPATSADGRQENMVEFEPKFVLDSPHRMQRLMNAAAGRIMQLPGHDTDVPMLSFPMSIGKDPTTGLPRVALGWRQESQGITASIMGSSDAEQTVQDQHVGSTGSSSALGLPGNASTEVPSSASNTILAPESDNTLLTFSSPSKTQKQAGGGFSLGFGSLGRITMRSSNDGQAKPSKAKAAAIKTPVVCSTLLKADFTDDDVPALTTALTTR